MWIHLLSLGLIDGASAVVAEVEDTQSLGGSSLTKRQKQGLREIYGYEKATTEIPEIPILQEVQESSVVSETIDIPNRIESQDIYGEFNVQEQLKDEEDIGLILAILEAHFN